MKNLLRGVFVTIILAVSAGNVYAGTSLININFNKVSYTGAGVVGTSGDKWNTFVGVSIQGYNKSIKNSKPYMQPISLVNSTGASSGVSITDYSFDSLNTIDDVSESFSVLAVGHNLMNGYAQTFTGNTSYVNLTGLKPGQNYRITVYSQNEMNTINYELETRLNNGTSVVYMDTGQDMGNASTFVYGQNYVQGFITPSSTGTLTISFNSIGGSALDFSPINGIQIEAVPEPRNVVLLGIGALLAGVSFRYKAKESVTVEL
jgi:hypothetical protein